MKNYREENDRVRPMNVMDLGPMILLHKLSIDAHGVEHENPYAIPLSTIIAVDTSHNDGSTILRTPNGFVCVMESVVEVAELYTRAAKDFAKPA